MRVETIKTVHGERYLLLNKNGEMVSPAMKFIKYRDNTGSAKNTLRRISYNLKLFFEFLDQKNIDFDRDFSKLDIDLMSQFVAWLKKPIGEEHIKLTSINPNDDKKRFRSPKTINAIIGTMMAFFEYLGRFEKYSNKMNEHVNREIQFKSSSFKSFLHHISTKDKRIKTKNMLLQRVPKDKIKTLTKGEVNSLLDACKNTRDKFLLFLLYETGIRIGEALALHLADIDLKARKLHILDRGNLENGAEIKTVGSVRSIDIGQDLTNLYSHYLLEIHDHEDVDTNFIFIKLRGRRKYEPMDYGTVVGLFDLLKTRTGIDVHAHMFRHTNITELVKLGMRPEIIQKRAGHKHFNTTLQYTGIDEEDVRREFERIKKEKEEN